MSPSPILEMRNISKTFGPVRALRDVSLTVYRGELHALMGENGAGKSTLIKAITGALRPDAGTIRVGGEPVHFVANIRRYYDILTWVTQPQMEGQQLAKSELHIPGINSTDLMEELPPL